jgi:serine/threonine protein kinase/Tfp pilus assembly protein PilF
VTEDESFLDQVLDFAVDARRSGQTIDPDSLIADRPHLASRIREALQLADAVSGTAPVAMLPSIDGYTLERRLGGGGMGNVYLAYQAALGGRPVALKVVRAPVFEASRVRRRFLAEAHILASLRHPHIVAIHDYGESGELAYFAMEWIDGESVADKLRADREARANSDANDRTRPERSGDFKEINDRNAWTCRLGIAIGSALSEVHRHGLVHRDVKPSNVMLGRDGVPKLTDFGIVSAPHLEFGTRFGEFVGTPAYASPEQLRGETDRVDSRSDVYSLGAVLYECLTGTPPFGDGGESWSVPATVETPSNTDWPASQSGPPIHGFRPRRRAGPSAILQSMKRRALLAPRLVNPRVPRDLSTVVSKALELSPTDRYATAKELVEDLERVLALQPIAASDVGLGGRAIRWMRRRPALANLLLGLSMIATTVLVWVLAVLPQWLRAEIAAAEERFESDSLMAWQLLDSGDPVGSRERFEALHGQRPERMEPFVGIVLSSIRSGSDVTATQYIEKLADVARGSRLFSDLRRAVQIAKSSQHQRPISTEEPSLDGNAIELGLRARIKLYSPLDASPAIAMDAYRMANEAIVRSTKPNLSLHMLRCEAAARSKDATLLGPAVDSLLGHWPSSPGVWYGLAWAYRRAGDNLRARDAYESCLTLDSNNSTAWSNLGNVQADLGDFESALVSYRRAIESNPRNYAAWYNAGNAFTKLERWDEAIEHLERTIQLESSFDSSRLNLGVALLGKGRIEQAIQQLDRYVARHASPLGLLNLAVAQARWGAWEDVVTTLIRVEPFASVLTPAQNRMYVGGLMRVGHFEAAEAQILERARPRIDGRPPIPVDELTLADARVLAWATKRATAEPVAIADEERLRQAVQAAVRHVRFRTAALLLMGFSAEQRRSFGESPDAWSYAMIQAVCGAMDPKASERADLTQAESMQCLAQLTACLEQAVGARAAVTEAGVSLDFAQSSALRELGHRLPGMAVEPELRDRLLDVIRRMDAAVKR